MKLSKTIYLLLTWLSSLLAAPLSIHEQSTVAQCEETQCEPVDCANPIRLNGACCPVCVEPGEYVMQVVNVVTNVLYCPFRSDYWFQQLHL